MLATQGNSELVKMGSLVVEMNQPAIFDGPRRDDWRTPYWLREKVKAFYMPLWDLAACADSTLAPKWHSAEASFLTSQRAWDGIAWLNPPFSQAEAFFKHVADAMRAEPCAQLVAIYKANLETAAWQKYILPTCSWVYAPARRVAYDEPVGGGVKKSQPQFASLIVGWNVPIIQGVPGHALIVKGTP